MKIWKIIELASVTLVKLFEVIDVQSSSSESMSGCNWSDLHAVLNCYCKMIAAVPMPMLFQRCWCRGFLVMEALCWTWATVNIYDQTPIDGHSIGWDIWLIHSYTKSYTQLCGAINTLKTVTSNLASLRVCQHEVWSNGAALSSSFWVWWVWLCCRWPGKCQQARAPCVARRVLCPLSQPTKWLGDGTRDGTRPLMNTSWPARRVVQLCGIFGNIVGNGSILLLFPLLGPEVCYHVVPPKFPKCICTFSLENHCFCLNGANLRVSKRCFVVQKNCLPHAVAVAKRIFNLSSYSSEPPYSHRFKHGDEWFSQLCLTLLTCTRLIATKYSGWLVAPVRAGTDLSSTSSLQKRSVFRVFVFCWSCWEWCSMMLPGSHTCV